ncbi:MAG: nuclear transport factor 2 family protein [Bacteroidetes bacterium]|nr:nuclear transport factor 2 family protein [Bacteroidota bacterium]MBU2586304.1 nuclear transport factor 2 family protein [Bacteroidota bacterium]
MVEKKTEYIKLNEEFYRAFESLDIKKMEMIWINDENAICIHPGWEIIIGWNKIKESWMRIFTSDSLLKFTIRNPRVSMFSDGGVVSCVEEIFVSSRERISQTFIASTNIFRKTDAGLKLIYHHSSPINSNDREIELNYN